ncbi:hypothetical protein [Burkholderia mayonis]|uniref:Uncharacterized protein n=1 Tax=Burkholderia mayonis TaxID=1385591 RepID=A0A1B4FXN5_9BURK|nr:hypothetical protein [Burkholderia mayonis]AOJ08426.1 hypothetical protein WS71_13305 [Burkholderia mayonis]
MAESSEFSKESFLSMIEKAVKPQFFLLTISFVLFVDAALAYFCGAGLLDVEAVKNSITASLAIKISLAFLGFSGLVSMVLPFAESLSIQLYYATLYRAWGAFEDLLNSVLGLDRQPFIRKQRENNCVRPSELLREAHETQSDFLLKLYNDYDRRDQRAKVDQRKMQSYAFCALFFTASNYLLPPSVSDHALTHWISAYCASSAPIWTALIVFAMLVFMPLHFDEWDSKWIYCPPLHRKLEAESEAARRKERQFQEEVERNVAQMRYERDTRRSAPRL